MIACPRIYFHDYVIQKGDKLIGSAKKDLYIKFIWIMKKI